MMTTSAAVFAFLIQVNSRLLGDLVLTSAFWVPHILFLGTYSMLKHAVTTSGRRLGRNICPLPCILAVGLNLRLLAY